MSSVQILWEIPASFLCVTDNSINCWKICMWTILIWAIFIITGIIDSSSFSQGNWWTKHLVHPKIWRPKPCQLMFASLVTLDGFHLLLSTQLTADLTPESSGRSMFHPLSHIYAKTPFCCVEKPIWAIFIIAGRVQDESWNNRKPRAWTRNLSAFLHYCSSVLTRLRSVTLDN